MSEAQSHPETVAPTQASGLRGLSDEHRSFIFWHAIVGAAFVNFVLSALIAWLSVRNEDSVPRWAAPLVDKPSTIGDTLGTFFILPLLTCLIFTAVARRELRHNRVQPLGWTWSPKSALRRLPHGTLRRGVALGVLCTVALGPPAVALIIALDVKDLTVGEFVWYKGIFGVFLGMVVTPIVALWALSEAEPAEPLPQAEPQPQPQLQV
jgi:hypothetical protein